MAFRQLQSFMRETSVDKLLPLEKVLNPFIIPPAGGQTTGTSKPSPQTTTISSVNAATVIANLLNKK